MPDVVAMHLLQRGNPGDTRDHGAPLPSCGHDRSGRISERVW